MSLLALAFSYDAVAGERESSVLRLMMSYSVPRDLVLAGKWIGGYLALAAPFFLAFTVALLIMSLFPDISTGPQDALATVVILAVSMLYLAVIYSLGILVSCRTQQATTSITVLLLIWVVVILAVPNMAPYITARLVSVPSRDSIDREKMELSRENGRTYQAKVQEEVARTGKTMREVYQDSVFQAKMKDSQEEFRQTLQGIEDNYTTKLQAQRRWATVVARLSPLTSFNLATVNLAAAGIEQEERFVEALKKYSTTWEKYSKEKRVEFDKYMEEQRKKSTDGGIIFTRGDMDRFNNLDLTDYPRFAFEYMPLKDRLALVHTDVLLLGIWVVLLFLLAYLSFLRYDV